MKTDRCDVCDERIVVDPGSRTCEECKEQARLAADVVGRYLEKLGPMKKREVPR